MSELLISSNETVQTIIYLDLLLLKTTLSELHSHLLSDELHQAVHL